MCSGLVFPEYISTFPQGFPVSRDQTLQCVTVCSWTAPQGLPGPATESQGLTKKRNNDTFSVLLHRQTICRAFLTDELTTLCSTSPVTRSEKQVEETEDNGLCVRGNKTPGPRTREGGLRNRIYSQGLCSCHGFSLRPWSAYFTPDPSLGQVGLSV